MDVGLCRKFCRVAVFRLFSRETSRHALCRGVAFGGRRHCRGEGLDAVAHGVPAGCRRQLAGVPGRVAGFERQRCRGPAAGIVFPDNVFCGNRL